MPTGIGHNNPPLEINKYTKVMFGVDFRFYNLSDRKDPTIWHVIYKVPESSKWKRLSTNTSIKDKAEEFAATSYLETKVKVENEIPVFKRNFSDVANEVIANWEQDLKDDKISSEALRGRKTKINSFLVPFFKGKTIDVIKQDDIDEYWRWRKQSHLDKEIKRIDKKKTNEKPRELALGTLNNDSEALSKVFNYAVHKDILKLNKVPILTPPQKKGEKVNRRGGFSMDEWNKIKTTLPDWVNAYQDVAVIQSRKGVEALVYFMRYTGLRTPEAYNMKWNMIEVATHQAHDKKYTKIWKNGKNKEGIAVADLIVYKRLMAWKKLTKFRKATDYIFPNDKGKRLGVRVTDEGKKIEGKGKDAQFNKLLTAADVPKRDPHDQKRDLYSLRHVLASDLLNANVSSAVVAELLDTGEKQIKNHYGHYSEDALADLVIPSFAKDGLQIQSDDSVLEDQPLKADKDGNIKLR